MRFPENTPPLVQRARLTLNVELELLTRQFGGGAVARVVDKDQWLRPAAVRGALRFWWRALYAHNYANLSAMRTAEAAIFGRAGDDDGGAGAASLAIVQREPGDGVEAWAPARGEALNGTYFAAVGMGGAADAELLPPGHHARLTLSATVALSQEQQQQVQAALVAWVTFGGSGARTRRGAGAVGWRSEGDAQRASAPCSLVELDDWLAALPRGGCTHDCFSLRRTEAVFRTAPLDDAVTAHKKLATLWRDFRQDRDHPANWDVAAGWGRSRWPEPDAVRVALGTHARWADGTHHAPARPTENRAPRAWLGLPIVMKFKDDQLLDRDDLPRFHPTRGRIQLAEPGVAHIVAVTPAGQMTSDRFASPVLHAVSRIFTGDGARYVGIVLITRPHGTLRPGLKDTRTVLDAGPWDAMQTRLINHMTRSGLQRIPPGGNP